MVTRPAHYNTRYRYDLSPRQKEVLDLITRGYTNAEIAEALGVTLDGAKYHVREILQKLHFESREEAAAYWRDYNRPLAKLQRAFSGLFGLGVLKTVVGTAGVIAAGAAVAGSVIAINASGGGDGDPAIGDDPPPTATPVNPTTPASPTAPATPTPGPAQQFTDRIAKYVADENVDELLTFATPKPFTCPGGEPQGAGGPFPLCNGARAGEVREGYVVARAASEAETIAPAAFRDALAGMIRGDLVKGTTGFTADGKTYVISFHTGRAEVVYLVLDVRPGGVHRIWGLGGSFEQTQAMLEGGQAITIAGNVTFDPPK